MKKFTLCSLFILAIASANAQMSSIHENFDISCATTAGFPTGWVDYNPITATIPAGQWTCGPDNGNGGTPGLLCTGIYSSGYHWDTAYFISPLLNFGSYTGKVFLRFDTKTTNIHLGGRLAVVQVPPDTSFGTINTIDTDVTSAMLPVISSGDSSGWVTHEIELTRFKTTGNFYIAFRYTSTDTSGSTWYLDNINTTTTGLGVSEVGRSILPLAVIGNSTSSQITLSYSAENAGPYQLAIYNVIGQKIYTQNIAAESGKTTFTINNLNLRPGMYLIKMGNDIAYGIAKAIIP